MKKKPWRYADFDQDSKVFRKFQTSIQSLDERRRSIRQRKKPMLLWTIVTVTVACLVAVLVLHLWAQKLISKLPPPGLLPEPQARHDRGPDF